MNTQHISKESRLWVFQSNTSFSKEIKKQMLNHINSFCENWESHGKKIEATVSIKDDTFLILIANVNGDNLCGKANDALIREVKSLNHMFHTSFLDHNNVAFLKNDSPNICHLKHLKLLYKNNIISNTTKVYNNHVDTLGAFESKWIINFKDSWMYKFI